MCRPKIQKYPCGATAPHWPAKLQSCLDYSFSAARSNWPENPGLNSPNNAIRNMTIKIYSARCTFEARSALLGARAVSSPVRPCPSRRPASCPCKWGRCGKVDPLPRLLPPSLISGSALGCQRMHARDGVLEGPDELRSGVE